MFYMASREGMLVLLGGYGCYWEHPQLKAQCLYEGFIWNNPPPKEEGLEHLAYLHLSGEEKCPSAAGCGIYLVPSPRTVIKVIWHPSYSSCKVMCWARGEGVIAEYEHGWKAQLVTIERVFMDLPSVQHASQLDELAVAAVLDWAGDIPVHIVPSWDGYDGDTRVANSVLRGDASDEKFFGELLSWKLWDEEDVNEAYQRIAKLERSGFRIDDDKRITYA